MRRPRYVVFDIDTEVIEGFADRESAVRFANWLARGRNEEHGVLVTDELRRGEVVWPDRSWMQLGALVS
ncbi:MAG TPA: hypothetical protein VGM44_13320 [Polyangiaceae bacterium]